MELTNDEISYLKRVAEKYRSARLPEMPTAAAAFDVGYLVAIIEQLMKKISTSQESPYK